MAGDPGGLLGDIIPDILGSNVCWTVILCLKSDGKLIFEPGSFFKSFNRDLLNFPERKMNILLSQRTVYFKIICWPVQSRK